MLWVHCFISKHKGSLQPNTFTYFPLTLPFTLNMLVTGLKKSVYYKDTDLIKLYLIFIFISLRRKDFQNHPFPPQLLLSIQFSCSVTSNSLWPHGLQHARPPCPSPTPRVYSYSCPLSRWCYPTISSSVVPFSSRLQSFPASGSFQMSQLTSGGQSSLHAY